ncbi:hypothetical protein K3495_g13935 [Podosphaera aphanis]|nr:hypothetical protein K3495_g13935 [Podosphaera aphanis]
MVKAALLQLVPNKNFYFIEPKSTAREMWVTLKNHYEPQCDADIDTLLHEFWSFSRNEGTEVDEYYYELTKLQTKTVSLDPTQRPSDLAKKNRLLSHFDSYRDGHYIGAIAVLRLDQSISFEKAVETIRSTQTSYLRTETTNFAGNVTADERTCAYCHSKKHIRETCFLWLETPDGTKWVAKNLVKAAKAQKLKEKFGSKPEPKSKEAEIFTDGAWFVGSPVSSFAENNQDIVLDTGACHHVFYDLSLFTSISPFSRKIQTATGNVDHVSGIGTVEFRVFDLTNKSKSKVIRFDNVWYLPSCTRNLISGSQLISDGFVFSTCQNGIKIFPKDGSILTTARSKAGTFCFNTSSFASDIRNKSLYFMSEVSSPSPLQLRTSRASEQVLADTKPSSQLSPQVLRHITSKYSSGTQ